MTRFRAIYILFLSFVLVLNTGCSSDDGIVGTGDNPKPENHEYIEGTAAIGAPLANTPVRIKGSNGGKVTGTTNADGEYAIDVKNLQAPYLIQVDTATTKLYSIETETPAVDAPVRSNVHPYTDVTSRNWFKVRNRDIDHEFDDDESIRNPPDKSDIDAIKDALKSLLILAFQKFGVTSDFDFFDTAFNANNTEFDSLLHHTQVKIKDNKITIILKDPESGFIAKIIFEFNLNDDLSALDDTPPVLPDPTGLIALEASATHAVVVWNVFTDNVGIAKYKVFAYENGTPLLPVYETPFPVYSHSNLNTGEEYCYEILAVDGAGNESDRTAQACVRPTNEDTTAPGVATNLTATATSSSTIALVWTPSQSNDVIGYDIIRTGSNVTDPKIATVISTNYEVINLLSDTSYSYVVQAIDAASNHSDNSNEASARTLATQNPVDTTPPVTIAIPPGGPYTSAQQVRLVCDDGVGGSGCAGTYYTTDNTAPTTASNLYNGPITISSNTTLRFFSIDVDTAGEDETEKTEAYIINIPPPNAPVVDGPALTNDNRPTWTWVSGGNGSGNYRYKLGNEDFSTGATLTTDQTYTPQAALLDGDHTLYVQESNSIGDWSVSGSFTVTVNTSITVNQPILTCPPSLTNDSAPSWSWVDGGGGDGTIRYKWDSTDLTSGATQTATPSVVTSIALSEGPHTLYVQAHSSAGFWSDSSNCPVLIDTIEPDTTAMPATGTYVDQVTVTLSCADVAGSGCGDTFYTTDDLAPTSAFVLYENPVLITATSTLRYFSVDLATNPEAVDSQTYTIVSNPVILSIDIAPLAASVYEGSTYQFAAIATFDDSSSGDVTSQVEWNSSDPLVADVNPQGLATGLNVGETEITVYHAAANLTSTTPTVLTVPSLQSISVAPIGPIAWVGAVRHYTAYGHYSDGSRRDMTEIVNWASNNTSVATISDVASTKGVATANDIGIATITATEPVSSFSGSAEFTIDNRPAPYFHDDFETGLTKWQVSGFDWGIVETTAVSPNHAVADSPLGNFIPSTSAAITFRSSIDISSSVSPILSFWQKFDVLADCPGTGGAGARDNIYAQVSNNGGANWTTLASWNCNRVTTWMHTVLDLTPYKASPVTIRFLISADADGTVGDGWTIDNVQIRERDIATFVFPFSDDFENGLGNWLISGWDWLAVDGESVQSGSKVITDSVGGPYPSAAASTIDLAGSIDISSATSPVLSFWQKFDVLADCPGTGGAGARDNIYAQVSNDGGVNWTTLASWNCNRVTTWMHTVLDLTPYKASPVTIRFMVRPDADGTVGDGWTIDNVQIRERDIIPITPITFPFSDDFESGLDNWLISGWDWLAVDGESVQSGSKVITDSVGGPYPSAAASTIDLASSIDISAATSPVLSFWQKFDVLADCPGTGGAGARDNIYAQVSNDGGVNWVTLASWNCNRVTTWMHTVLDLTPYMASPVTIRFMVRPDADGAVGDGWTIDNVKIRERDITLKPFPFSDGFEEGLGNWLVSGWDWQEFDHETPVVGNLRAITDSVGGPYTPAAASTIDLAGYIDISTATSPVLSFWHKVDVLTDCPGTGGAGARDNIYVQVSNNGGVDWVTLASWNCIAIATWRNEILDLTPYQASPITIRFMIRPDADGTVGDGWSIDNVEIR